MDPSIIITHTLPLADAARGYDIFHHRKENCIKVVLKP
jgi:threonine dehydrogenase-like Zn-dependent dehydrogenase